MKFGIKAELRETIRWRRDGEKEGGSWEEEGAKKELRQLSCLCHNCLLLSPNGI